MIRTHIYVSVVNLLSEYTYTCSVKLVAQLYHYTMKPVIKVSLNKVKSLMRCTSMQWKLSLRDNLMMSYILMHCKVINYLFLLTLQINGEEIPIGIDKEPIQITISHGSESQIKRGFPKLLTLGELRLMVCSLAQLDPDTTTVNRVSIRGMYMSRYYHSQ